MGTSEVFRSLKAPELFSCLFYVAASRLNSPRFSQSCLYALKTARVKNRQWVCLDSHRLFWWRLMFAPFDLFAINGQARGMTFLMPFSLASSVKPADEPVAVQTGPTTAFPQKSVTQRRYGFAAGCEAALGAAVKCGATRRATPSIRALPKRFSHLGPSPNRGHSPITNHDLPARQSHAHIRRQSRCHDLLLRQGLQYLPWHPRAAPKRS